MTWSYIYNLLGPGLHWSKPQSLFRDAVFRAEKEGFHDAAEHIRIIWRMRNDVMMESMQNEPEPPHRAG